MGDWSISITQTKHFCPRYTLSFFQHAAVTIMLHSGRSVLANPVRSDFPQTRDTAANTHKGGAVNIRLVVLSGAEGRRCEV